MAVETCENVDRDGLAVPCARAHFAQNPRREDTSAPRFTLRPTDARRTPFGPAGPTATSDTRARRPRCRRRCAHARTSDRAAKEEVKRETHTLEGGAHAARAQTSPARRAMTPHRTVSS